MRETLTQARQAREEREAREAVLLTLPGAARALVGLALLHAQLLETKG